MNTLTLLSGFNIGDVEDSQFAAAYHVDEWMKTEAGKFAMDNSIDGVILHSEFDPGLPGHRFTLVTTFDDKTHTFWKLKYQ